MTAKDESVTRNPPWLMKPLDEWSIVGMNHYFLDGKLSAGCAIDRPLIQTACYACKGTGRVPFGTKQHIDLDITIPSAEIHAVEPRCDYVGKMGPCPLEMGHEMPHGAPDFGPFQSAKPLPGSLQQLGLEIREINAANGWAVTKPEEFADKYKFPAVLMLIVSEAAEALEAFREGDVFPPSVWANNSASFRL